MDLEESHLKTTASASEDYCKFIYLAKHPKTNFNSVDTTCTAPLSN
jgi:hypothetical protein